MSEITSDSLNRDIIRKRNAEIEQLKVENDSLIEQFMAIRETCYAKDKLISELCDVLESCCLELSWDALPGIEKQRLDLLQRAREATR